MSCSLNLVSGAKHACRLIAVAPPKDSLGAMGSSVRTCFACVSRFSMLIEQKLSLLSAGVSIESVWIEFLFAVAQDSELSFGAEPHTDVLPKKTPLYKYSRTFIKRRVD